MRIAYSLILCLTVIVTSIDLSLQTSNPWPGDPGHETPHSHPRHYASGSSSRYSSTAVPPLRSRSRSPTANASPSFIIGYKLEELRFIRLIPKANPSKRFEIRRYTFPHDKELEVRADHVEPEPMPVEEQTVLSTSNGDVLAIVEGNNRLRGFYIRKDDLRKRSKINMYSGVVEKMTPEEIRQTPLGKSSISKFFEILHIQRESPTHTSHPGPGAFRSGISQFADFHASGSSSRPSLPAKPASSDLYILGFKYEYIKFLRLIPHANPLRRFEIRRYTFPRDKKIYMKGYHNAHVTMPTEEKTVLSTANGEVMGMVEDNRRLRAFYTMRVTTQKRAKINMYSGLVEIMTTEEMQETPLPKHGTIFDTFVIELVNNSPTNSIHFSSTAHN